MKQKSKASVWLLSAYIRACRLTCFGKRKTVLFESFGGKAYSDNPRAISEALHTLFPQAELVWSLRRGALGTPPDYVKTVDPADRLAYWRTVACADVWVNNCTFPLVPKARWQSFVQTWHGDRAFKKILNDAGYRTKAQYVHEGKAGYIDLAVAGSAYGVMQYRSAFAYPGEILTQGTPRNDCLLQNDESARSAIRRALGLPMDVRLLLFAPTLRGADFMAHRQQEISLDLGAVRACLQERTGERWLCLIRAHPAICGLAGVAASDWLIDVSKCPDMAELLQIADFLITDYSSSAGDFALRRKPILLFQPDRADYMAHDRALYFDMASSPFFVADKQSDVLDWICRNSPADWQKNCDDILAFYQTQETGHAARLVAQWICDRLGKE